MAFGMSSFRIALRLVKQSIMPEADLAVPLFQRFALMRTYVSIRRQHATLSLCANDRKRAKSVVQSSDQAQDASCAGSGVAPLCRGLTQRPGPYGQQGCVYMTRKCSNKSSKGKAVVPREVKFRASRTQGETRRIAPPRTPAEPKDPPAVTQQVFAEAPAMVPLAAVELTATTVPRLLHLQKADAAASLGLLVRDMRPVDSTFRSNSPTIIARDAGIIVHLERIRVIITNARVLVFDPANPAVEQFIPRLHSRLKSTSHPMPFELRAFEGVLVDLCSSLSSELSTLTPSIDIVLDTLSTTTDFGGNTVQVCLDRLLPLENALDEFSVRVDQIRQALHEVLASDEDMSTMYLSAYRNTGHRRRVDQHDEVEMMLENYIKQIDAVHSEVTSTLRQVKATENVTQIRLDAMRNRILRLEVFLNLGAVSVATGGLVAGAFGMNLHTGWEESAGMFWVVSATAVLVSVIAFRGSLLYLRYRGIFR